MGKPSPIDSNLVALEGTGPAPAVLYRGRPVGQIYDTGRRFCNGRDVIWSGMNVDDVFYSHKAAAIAEARRWNGELQNQNPAQPPA